LNFSFEIVYSKLHDKLYFFHFHIIMTPQIEQKFAKIAASLSLEHPR